jgi:hypothetical protein
LVSIEQIGKNSTKTAKKYQVPTQFTVPPVYRIAPGNQAIKADLPLASSRIARKASQSN